MAKAVFVLPILNMLDEKLVLRTLLKLVKNLDDVAENPAKNPTILAGLCKAFNIRKKHEIRKFRARLFFLWNKDDFAKMCKSELKKKKCTNANVKNQTKKIMNTGPNPPNPVTFEADDEDRSQDLVNKFHRVYMLIRTLSICTSDIIRDNVFSFELFHFKIRCELPKQCGIQCILIFKGIRLSSNGAYRDYALCKQPLCHMRFKFIVYRTDLQFKIQVFATDNQPNHTEPLAYQLRGPHRKLTKKSLQFAQPSTIHDQIVNEMDVDLASKNQNFQFTHSLKTLQKARSELACVNDEHRNDSADIVLRLSKFNYEHHYIHKFITPFTIYLGIPEQIQLLISFPNLTLHFDATGSVVRKPYAYSKRVYYYAGVVCISHKIYPLLEIITNHHTAASLSDSLKHFKNLWCSSNIRWSPFKEVTTDWSWASINAILLAWNDLTVLDYLKICHRNINSSNQLEITPVYTCYPHFMKMVSRKLFNDHVKSTTRSFVLEIVAILVHCDSYRLLKQCIEFAFIIFSYPKINNTVQKALDDLYKVQIGQKDVRTFYADIGTSDNDFEDPDESEEEPEDTKPNHGNNKAVSKLSPFYIDILPIKIQVEKVVKVLPNELSDNPYYCLPFISYAMNRLIPFIPFWSIAFKKSKKHSSNGTVENFFKRVKLEKNSNIKAGHFIDRRFEAISASYKLLDLSNPKVHTRKRHGKIINEPDNLLSEEGWNRNSSQQSSKLTYQAGKRLKRVVNKQKLPPLIFNHNSTIQNQNYYYYKNAPRIYFVACSKNLNGSGIIYLNGEDYMTLFDNQWLSNFTIDYCASIYIGESSERADISYVLCEVSSNILLNYCDNFPETFYSNLKKQWLNKKKLFFPVNAGGIHWCLLYVDLMHGFIYLLDPARKNHYCSDLYFNNFKNFYKILNPDSDINWQVKTINYPCQQDGFNCGVFVIYYMKELLKSNNIKLRGFDPNLLRKQLQVDCLLKSLEVLNRCTVCGQEELRRVTDWVLCNTCNKSSHFSCLSYLNKTFKDIQKKQYNYNCDLCKQWCMQLLV